MPEYLQKVIADIYQDFELDRVKIRFIIKID